VILSVLPFSFFSSFLQDYVAKVQLTLLIMLLAAAIFFAACLVRLALHTRRAWAAALAGDELDLDDLEDEESRSESSPNKADAAGNNCNAHAAGGGGGGGGSADKPPQRTATMRRAGTLRRGQSVRRVATLGAAAAAGAAGSEAAAPLPPSLLHPVHLFRSVRSTPAWSDFRHRTLHAFLILLSIFFLRVCTLCLKGFACASAPDPALQGGDSAAAAAVSRSLYLTEDMQTKCFVGGHRTTVAGVVALLLLYMVGYPAAVFVGLMRAFATPRTPGLLGWLRRRFACLRGKRKRRKRTAWALPRVGPAPMPAGSDPAAGVAVAGADTAATDADKYRVRVLETDGAAAAEPGSAAAAAAAVTAAGGSSEPTEADLERSRQNSYGFLYLGYRQSHFAACIGVFATNIYVAAVSVFGGGGGDSILQLFLCGLLWAAQAVAVSVQLPYSDWVTNVQKVLVSLGMLVRRRRTLPAALLYFCLLAGCRSRCVLPLSALD